MAPEARTWNVSFFLVLYDLSLHGKAHPHPVTKYLSSGATTDQPNKQIHKRITNDLAMPTTLTNVMLLNI